MKKHTARSKGKMFAVLVADAIGSMYAPALPGFKRTAKHSLATIRAALDKAGLLRDPVA